MTRHYVHYWNPRSVKDFFESIGEGGDNRLNHTASDLFTHVEPGDFVWIVTIEKPRRLRLLGRIIVDQIMNQAEMNARSGKEVWDAKYHVVPARYDEHPVREIDITDLSAHLRFMGSNTRLPPNYTGQSFQALRQLTQQTAELLGRRLMQEEAEEKSITSLEIGRTYRRRDLHRRFGGQQQSGISTPAGHPLILLFTGESGEQYGYSDHWDGKQEVFFYVGQGREGDMEFTRGNRAIRDHAENGKTLLLFESLGKGRETQYVGEFTCASWEERRGPDVNGDDRKVIVFHLVRVDEFTPADFTAEPDLDINALRKQAYESATSPSKGRSTNAKRNVYDRRRKIKAYALRRANGVCESCGQESPFHRRDGTPYLETHHTLRVASGGPDHPQWVAAICPNCHREIEFGVNGESKNKSLIKYLRKREKDG